MDSWSAVSGETVDSGSFLGDTSCGCNERETWLGIGPGIAYEFLRVAGE